jgi:hypothetical protein
VNLTAIMQNPSEGADNRWRGLKEMDCLEGPLDRITAVIQSTSAQERLVAPAEATEMDLDKIMEDSPDVFCSHVLRSSLKAHQIVDFGLGQADTVPQPRVGVEETPEEKLDRWKASPLPAVAGSDGANIEAIGEKEKPSDIWSQQAEDRFEQTIVLSHWSWCLKTLALQQGSGRNWAIKINRLFQWKKQKSLILHEVAKAAGLESSEKRSVVDTIYMGEVESSCAYCVPLEDWKGETVYPIHIQVTRL